MFQQRAEDAAGVIYLAALSLKEAGGRLYDRFSREQEAGDVREAEPDEDGMGASFPPVQPGPRKHKAARRRTSRRPRRWPPGKTSPTAARQRLPAEVASDSGRERVSATLVPRSPRGAQNGTRRLSDSSALGQGRPESPMQQHLQRCED